MELHLVDATYELFRAYYSPRPAVKTRDGRDVGAVVGLVYTLLTLLRDEGATHVGCATDHVIRSFRNELYPGYKTEAGVPAELLAQFPLAERAMEALGVVVWPMVEFEADDALATAAARWAGRRGVERIWICTPDKDLAQCVTGDRVVLRDRRRGLTIDAAGVRKKWGVPPASIPDYLALVGDSADGFPGLPGWGARSAAAVLARFPHLETIPAAVEDWHVNVRSAGALNTTLRAKWPDAMLYRHLATLRTDVPLPQDEMDELRWLGARRGQFVALCEELDQPRLAERPHLWRD
ncbi:MAG TPA: 5'-3' exonuclease H3TH domain-containing protein [Candidatus Limnocylindrales bacterium]|jgi:5''-3'' exonuclease (including N-terminal domain of PolI)|nr:5'-3' exonuclease H3TH domain-containing protein [Candidatus Limnocylindrales bacterium]